jgi:ABC-type sugar transport system ATPase subunit
MTNKQEKTLEAVDIVKRFGDTLALSQVSLELKSGEIHGLVGHNGAGKSTLLRIFSGSIKPDSGILLKDGNSITLNEPMEALKLGVATVYQELSLLPNLTIAENAFLGFEISKFPFLERRRMEEQTKELLKRFDLEISPRELLGELSVAQRQLIEIAIAVHRRASFLLLDEPTSSLEANQINRALELIETLAEQEKIGILFIGHKIDELLKVSHKLTALTDGKVTLYKERKDFNREEIVNAVIGTARTNRQTFSVPSQESYEPKQTGDLTVQDKERECVLEVDNIKSRYLKGIKLRLKKNKVLGIYGLVGSGRSRFLRTLIGVEPMDRGFVNLFGVAYTPNNPRKAAEAGIVYLTEDRKLNGFIPQMSARKNVLLPVLGEYSKSGWLNLRALDREAINILSNLRVLGDTAGSMIQLSGGNQQKVLFARAVRQNPKILLLDEPTKGVDIGAKNEIYGLISHLTRDKNISIIMVSSEEEEILRVSDEIVIFKQGGCDGTVYLPSEMDEKKLRTLAWYQAELPSRNV